MPSIPYAAGQLRIAGRRGHVSAHSRVIIADDELQLTKLKEIWPRPVASKKKMWIEKLAFHWPFQETLDMQKTEIGTVAFHRKPSLRV